MSGLNFNESDLTSLQITITNTAFLTKTFSLFDGTGITNVSNGKGDLMFSNPDAYNYLIWNIKAEPIRVFKVDLITSSIQQFDKVFQVNHVDANGQSYIEPYFPSSDFSAYQQQTNKVSIPFNNLVLDGNSFFKDYEILPRETVSFVLWYIQENKNLYDDSSLMMMIKNPLSIDVIKNMT